MGNYDEKSVLKSNDIKKVLLNQKDYTFQDFKFKIVEEGSQYWKSHTIEVYDFDSLILKVDYTGNGLDTKPSNLNFDVIYFNPKTNNDCNSINHIIAVFSDECEEKHQDRGNAHVINNQYVFRRKDNYYSYTKVWVRGKILKNNYDKDLSHEFATEEYINNIKKVFDFKRMPRRDLKKKIKELINNAVSHEQKRKLVEAIDK